MSDYSRFQTAGDNSSSFAVNSFLVNTLINKIAPVALVKVVPIKNAGESTPVCLVDIIPIVHQVDGDGNPTLHGVIHDIPYLRLQGGTNEVIIDPVINDIGLALFVAEIYRR